MRAVRVPGRLNIARRGARRSREATALLVSVNLHLWALAALTLSLSWPDDPEPPPEPLEVELVALPRPAPRLTAAASAVSELPAPRMRASALPARELELPEPGPERPETARRREIRRTPEAARTDPPEPIVECRIRVAAEGAPPPAEPAAPPLLVGSAREAPLPVSRVLAAIARPRTPAPAVAGDPPVEALPFHPLHLEDLPDGSRLPPLTDTVAAEPGSSRLTALELIQARIDAISPLVHRTTPACRTHSGRARIRFLINRRGYPIGYQLLRSTGSACLDAQIGTVLHLAEPYPTVAGWVPVRVFGLGDVGN